MAAETNSPPLTVDQICDFLELLHQFLNKYSRAPLCCYVTCELC